MGPEPEDGLPDERVPYPVCWLVLVLSGVLEAVWATALGRSDGLSRPVPVAVFAVALALSMGGLGYAMR